MRLGNSHTNIEKNSNALRIFGNLLFIFKDYTEKKFIYSATIFDANYIPYLSQLLFIFSTTILQLHDLFFSDHTSNIVTTNIKCYL